MSFKKLTPKITYPDLKTVTYGYDADSRLTTVTDWASRVTSYTYDNNNRLIHTSRADGSYEDYVYNSAGQLTEYSDHDSQNALISHVLYSYNEDGRLVSETQTNSNGHTETNTYSSVERLADQQVTENGQPIDGYTYTYDAGGNITSATKGSITDTYTYGTANQLSTYNGSPVIHDAEGNITTATSGGATVNYAFDVRNRLTSAGDFTFGYDLQNRRISKVENTTTTTYLQNPIASLPQVLSKTVDGTSTYYIYGLGLIAEETGTDYKTYHYDQRGSTKALTNSSGLVTDTYDYGPYGELISHTGTNQVDYLYNGRDGVITDSEDLYYMRARYYSTDLRRFLSEDNFTGKYDNILGMNLYGYVNGNPVQYVDPSGNEGTMDYGGGGVGGAIGIYCGKATSSPDFYMDTQSLAKDVSEGNVGAVVLDAIGMAIIDVDTGTIKAGVSGVKNFLKSGLDVFSSPSSKILRQNMIEAGIDVPNYINAAHHIVAGSSAKATEARAILQKFRIDINDAINGVFLPTVKDVAEGAYHRSLHTDAYYRKVIDLLSGAKSKDDVIDILDDIAEQLSSGTFN